MRKQLLSMERASMVHTYVLEIFYVMKGISILLHFHSSINKHDFFRRYLVTPGDNFIDVVVVVVVVPR